MNPVLEEDLELTQDQDDKEKETEQDEILDPDGEEFEMEDFMNDDDLDHE